MLGFVLHYIKIQKEVMKKKLNTGREQKYVSKDVPYQLQVCVSHTFRNAALLWALPELAEPPHLFWAFKLPFCA